MELAVNIRGLTKTYKKFRFGPNDFTVEQGTATAIVGPNGSGKSTLFRLMMNLIHAHMGTIQLLGKNMSQDETVIKQQVGYAGGGHFQGMGQLSIHELANICSYWYSDWKEETYSALLKRYHIDPSQKYLKCSTGTQKKVEFIFALSHAPRLLLLDEPTAGVDMISQRKMKEDLTDYMDSGENTLILSTHMMDDVKNLCDYICVLHQGKVVAHFDKDDMLQRWTRLWVSSVPEEILAHPAVKDYDLESRFFVTDNCSELEKILTARGITITHEERLGIDEIMTYITHSNSS